MKTSTVSVLLIWLALGGVTVATGAPAVRIESVEVGFDGYYRPGHMVPVFVRLTNTQAEAFNGYLQVVHSDDDGDLVRWRCEAALGPRQRNQVRMVLMCPKSDTIGSDANVAVSVTDAGGTPVDFCMLNEPDERSRRLLRRLPAPVVAGRRVVGVIGSGAGVLGQLNTPEDVQQALVHTAEPVHVLAVPPRSVPATWQGLDMIDVLFWDNPRAQDLDNDQQAALDQWVRRGGQLVVGLGNDAGQLVSGKGKLRDLLPVRVVRTGVPVKRLHVLGDALLGWQYRGWLDHETWVVTVLPRPGASAWTGTRYPGKPLLYRWARGAGGVTAMCTTLRNSRIGQDPWYDSRRALAELLGIRVYSQAPGDQFPASVSRGMSSYLDSAGVGGLLVGLAVLMMLGYAAVAGPGTWLYLRYKNKRHLSWWVFGAAVVAATLGSVLLSLFGIRGASVSNALVLDLPAGSSWAVVRGYFGLYEPSHRTVTVGLVDDEHGWLVPMIEPSRLGLGGFPDVRQYDVDSARLTELSVPVRRTIKRFALSWQGDVGAEVKGSMSLEPIEVQDAKARGGVRSDWILRGSIVNGLPVDLRQPVLIYAQPPTSAADDGYRALRLGDIPSGQTLAFDNYKVLTARDPRTRDRAKLTAYHKRLCSRLSLTTFGFDVPVGKDFLSQMGMLSTLALYDQPRRGQGRNDPLLMREVLGRMDRSDQIRAGRALLIAAADDYMPAKLRFDRRSVEVTGTTVVRVLFDVAAPDRSSGATEK